MTFSRICAAGTKLTGLDPELEYEKFETGEAFSGNELMELGFYDLVVHQDYTSKMYRFKGI
ncbi:GH36 C-terminal domain-containing protein [uncultured Ligilactobacillus sp.]|uniref:GH36 C-terminal domain-containing protein n=1 Tax=uncultured Ligilactobacillus sp. TaxID=2837633 RepID=UPI002597EFB8|nr:GH36 C-terminal domain-containing protein [uncultured Ligilactobacillus sp.]